MPALAGNSGPQPVVAVEPVPACHAGGRGFESRRFRKVPANRHIALSGRTRQSARLHKRAFGWSRNGPKRTENPSERHEDKPFAAASRTASKTAGDYTKWPEVKALPAVAAESISPGVRDGVTERRAARDVECRRSPRPAVVPVRLRPLGYRLGSRARGVTDLSPLSRWRPPRSGASSGETRASRRRRRRRR
jgi:hypothetical protein